MTRRPKLLDLFSGAGGAGMGYHRAGFDVTGVDLHPQPEYPFAFLQADVMTISFAGFDAVHASPPCQAYSRIREVFKTAKRDHPELIEPIREKLIASGLPYVIENVVGSPLISPLVLCGSSFGLRVRRHRLFESNLFMLGPSCSHGIERSIAVYGDHPQTPGDKSYNINRARTLAEGRAAMGIDWMTWRSLTQAIPPAYTEHIGRQLLRVVERLSQAVALHAKCSVLIVRK